MGNRKKSLSKELPGYMKLFFVLNALAIIGYLIRLLDFMTWYNNFFLHTLYNLTSVFLIIPYYLVFGWKVLLLGKFSEWPTFNFDKGGLEVYLTFAPLILSFLLNYFYAKILMSEFFLRLYEKYLKLNPFLRWGIPIGILLAFIFG